MTQADRVYITPPPNTSADNDPRSPEPCNCLMCLAEGDNSPHRIRSAMGGAPSRRRFLATAAGASVLSVGSLAAAALAPSAPAAVIIPAKADDSALLKLEEQIFEQHDAAHAFDDDID